MITKWVVTGGTGFLGQHIGAVLRARGVQAEMWGRTHCDLLLPHRTLTRFQEARPEVVIHAAGQVGGIGANRASPWTFWHDNLQMGMNLLNACLASGVKRIVLLGTTCSYPAEGVTPLREEDLFDGYPEQTNAPYGIAKRSLLTGALAYARQFGVEIVAPILANLYGPGDNFDLETGHVIPSLIAKMAAALNRKSTSVEVWGSGEVCRDFLYAEDAANGIVDAAYRAPSGTVLNLGSGEEVTINNLCRILAKVMGYKGTFHHDTSRPDGQVRRLLDTSKASRLLGWKAKTDLHEGLMKTYRSYVSRQEVKK